MVHKLPKPVIDETQNRAQFRDAIGINLTIVVHNLQKPLINETQNRAQYRNSSDKMRC